MNAPLDVWDYWINIFEGQNNFSNCYWRVCVLYRYVTFKKPQLTFVIGIISTDYKVHLYWFDVHYASNCFVHTQKIYIAALTSGSDKSRINTDVYFLIHSSYRQENKWQKSRGISMIFPPKMEKILNFASPYGFTS